MRGLIHSANESGSEFEDTAGADHVLPFESLIDVSGRKKLESDVLAIAVSSNVQMALKEVFSMQLLNENQSGIQAAAKSPQALKRVFEYGVRALLNASCDRRLEISHWTVSTLQREGKASDIMEWFFIEAESQMLEAGDEDVELIGRIFGMSVDWTRWRAECELCEQWWG